MLPDINVYKILEIIGTIAFASSGAMVAVKRRLDYLGIVVLGVTTAVGGGMCGISSSARRLRECSWIPPTPSSPSGPSTVCF